MATDRIITSPSRSYVAMCNKGSFDGYYFKQFTLPTELKDVPHFAQNYAACHNIKNDAEYACWYFLNVLDSYACIQCCIPLEDYRDLKQA